MSADIGIFFEPLGETEVNAFAQGTIGYRARFHTDGQFPEISKRALVIFGVNEFRASDLTGEPDTLQAVRSEFYTLKDHFQGTEVIDLGNIEPGQSVDDTYYAVSNSIAEIVKQGGLAVVIGGSQDLTYANYLAYEKLEQVVNLVTVDSRFDIGDVDGGVRADCYLQKIILHQPNILFNYSNLGYQTHHSLPQEIKLMQQMYFDVYRLGEVQSDLESVEPVVRNADILSFDVSSIRSSDLPNNHRQEPNGLYGEEACAVMRYAGLSDKLTSIGLFNVTSVDQRSAKLLGQMLWYLALGVHHRKSDYPFADKSEYTKYTVSLKDGSYDVVFYKSGRSDRWWMEVPYPTKRGEKYERHFMVPCSYSDYLKACNDEMPDRWWQTFQKLG